VLHRARGIRGDRVLVDLQVHFGVFEEGDPVDRGDFWAIHGDDRPLEIHAPGGLDSLDSTVAVTANVAAAVAELPPGLRSMLELPVGALAAEGAAPQPG
jgi:4-hydroxy-tetrahydrodipicolinate reductase